MPGVRCTHGFGQKECPGATGSPGSTRHSLRSGFTAYFALFPVTGYQIHTFLRLRVVPYLMGWKASRPMRITFGPGFP